MSSFERTTLSVAGSEHTTLVAGDVGDPLVVMIHGFPDSPETFRHQVGPLVAAGYRVAAPTLRGYEPSSLPSDGDYSLTTLADDVVRWLDALGADRAHLVGHDWGAAITHVVSGRSPERVLTATTMAVPPLGRVPAAVRRVPRQLMRSWYMTFFQLRGVAERTLVASDWRLVKMLWRGWSPGHTMDDSDWWHLREMLAAPGVLGATLGYYRQNATPPIMLGVRTTDAMKVLQIDVPTLVINGADDGCMDRRLFEHATRDSDFPAGIQRLEVKDAGHFVHLEQPDVVNKEILKHLAKAG